jgi:1,4-dihydroxy-2-naphthoate octaprenyltransferase
VNHSHQAPLWLQIGRQSIWGKRGIAKTGSFWLPASVLCWHAAGEELDTRGLVYLLLFLAGVCRTQAATLSNDLADRAQDLAAGKSRWISSVPRRTGHLIVAASAALGVLLLLFAGAPRAVHAAFLLSTALAIFYSVPPVRFKARGIQGLLAFSFSCACFYVLAPWLWFSGNTAVSVFLLLAVFLDKWVNLHFHQIVDYEADRALETGTYVVRAGLARARETLAWFAVSAILAMTGLLVVLWIDLPWTGRTSVMLCGAVVLAASGHAFLARRRPDRASALVKELPPLYLGLAFGVWRVLPILLFLPLALEHPGLWIPAGIAAAVTLADSLFYSSYRYS